VITRSNTRVDRYHPFPKGEEHDVRIWRETIQIPDYIVTRAADCSDRYFVSLRHPNKGYVFRLRKTKRELDPGVLLDYDSGVPAGDYYRVECIVKGFFTFTSQWSSERSRMWGCICYDGSSADGIAEIDSIQSEIALQQWLRSIIGPNKEIAPHNLGKWRPGQGLSFLNDFPPLKERPFEPWTAMFEQQFSSMFAVLAANHLGAYAEQQFENYFIGYREWSHIRTPLDNPITIQHGVPQDWDSQEFWDGWRSYGRFGELMFDFWARDIDNWWFDTLRKQGLTVCIVPENSQVIWLPATDLDEAAAHLKNGSRFGKALPRYREANELAEALLVGVEKSSGQLKLGELRQKIYEEPQGYPVDYSAYDAALYSLLDRIDFFEKAELFLKANSVELVVCPIRGRTLVV